jgi:hypothetical protein
MLRDEHYLVTLNAQFTAYLADIIYHASRRRKQLHALDIRGRNSYLQLKPFPVITLAVKDFALWSIFM